MVALIKVELWAVEGIKSEKLNLMNIQEDCHKE